MFLVNHLSLRCPFVLCRLKKMAEVKSVSLEEKIYITFLKYMKATQENLLMTELLTPKHIKLLSLGCHKHAAIRKKDLKEIKTFFETTLSELDVELEWTKFRHTCTEINKDLFFYQFCTNGPISDDFQLRDNFFFLFSLKKTMAMTEIHL